MIYAAKQHPRCSWKSGRSRKLYSTILILENVYMYNSKNCIQNTERRMSDYRQNILSCNIDFLKIEFLVENMARSKYIVKQKFLLYI